MFVLALNSYYVETSRSSTSSKNTVVCKVKIVVVDGELLEIMTLSHCNILIQVSVFVRNIWIFIWVFNILISWHHSRLSNFIVACIRRKQILHNRHSHRTGSEVDLARKSERQYIIFMLVITIEKFTFKLKLK